MANKKDYQIKEKWLNVEQMLAKNIHSSTTGECGNSSSSFCLSLGRSVLSSASAHSLNKVKKNIKKHHLTINALALYK